MEKPNDEWRATLMSLNLIAHYTKKFYSVKVSPSFLLKYKDDPGFPKPLPIPSPQRYFFGEVLDWILKVKGIDK